MSVEIPFYESKHSRKARLRKQRLKNEERAQRRANETPEEREARLARSRELEKQRRELTDDRKERLEKHRRRLRERNLIRYNCESLEQYGKRLKRTRGRLYTRPRDIRLEDKTKVKNQKKGRIVTKKKEIEVKKEPEEEMHDGVESDESPEDFIERKTEEFKLMELQLQIDKAKDDLKKETRKTERLLEQMQTIRTRAKELQEFFGIPICSKTVN